MSVDPRIAEGLNQLAAAQEAAEADDNPELAELIAKDIGNVIGTQISLQTGESDN